MDWLAAIRVTDEIDLTGIATVILAGATAGLAWWTRQAVTQGRTEIERAHRPVLVPKIDRAQSFTPWATMGGFPLAPAFEDSTLHVPVRNVGMGPALYVRAHVEFGDVEGHRSAAPEAISELELAGVSHLEPWVILSFRRTGVSGLIGFVLTLSYEDVAGQRSTTRARYSHQSQSFPEVKIETG